jgi:predicted deacylase
MKNRLKIEIKDHFDTFGDNLGVSKKRFSEIRDAVFTTFSIQRGDKRHDIVDAIQNELGGFNNLGEVFITGSAYGVMEHLAQKGIDDAKMETDPNTGSAMVGGLNVEEFLKAMKDGTDDF